MNKEEFLEWAHANQAVFVAAVGRFTRGGSGRQRMR